MTDAFDTPAMNGGATGIPRDRYGRPLVVPPGGGKPTAYTRATTVADTLDDRYNLELWKLRQVASGLSRRRDLVALAAAQSTAYATAVERDNSEDEKAAKRALDQICSDAMAAAASGAAANLGTAEHQFVQEINEGRDPVIPEDLRDDIDAYRNALDGWDVLAAEQFLVLDEQRIGGTADVILRHRQTGITRIGDLKTGRHAVTFGQTSIAMQLSIYSRGVIYHADTGDREPINVDQDKAIVIHLPVGSGRCTLYEIDIAAGWEAVQHALWVRQWRKHKNLVEPLSFARMATTGDDKAKQQVGVPDSIRASIAAAQSVASLEDVYRWAVKDGVASDELVPMCAARKAEILSAA